MKWGAVVILAFVCGAFASPLAKNARTKSFPKECGVGPAYWCHNITSARDCGALKHCIQTVWEHTKLEPDNDDICTICKNMVTQARDQLESNETQEELKEVFEGSCRLIPVKVVAEECVKMSDEFIPELVDTLASQMNPQMVCATAGLCNSVRVDKLLAQYKKEQSLQVLTSDNPYAKFGVECSNCHTVVSGIQKKLAAMPDDQILAKMVKACGYLGSLSSGCHEVVISNFNTIVKHIREHFNPREVCDLAGVCKAKHHEHAQIAAVVIPRSEVGVTSKNNDETCDLCKQLVHHLRDVLVSNTTEEEFKEVLLGLCGQTRNFKQQCTSIVEEYYPVIYTFLTAELNPQMVCDFAGICHEELASGDVDGPMWLELPARHGLPMKSVSLKEAADLFSQKEELIGGDETKSYSRRKPIGWDEGQIYPKRTLIGGDEDQSYAQEKLIGGDEAKSYSRRKPIGWDEGQIYPKRTLIGGDEDQSYAQEKLIGGDEAQSYIDPVFVHAPLAKVGSNVRVVNSMQLPIERLMPQSMVGSNKEVCEFCQYFLHYVQEQLASPASEAEIKELVDEACDHLPKVIGQQCRSFVVTYGDAIVALLAQEMDPSQLCPALGLCPTRKNLVVSKEKDSPTCPLCLYAMEQLDNMIKEDKTEANIRSALEKVCSLLPKSMTAECDQLVDKYSEELVDMLIADFTPQEICVYLKMCAPKLRPTSMPQAEKDEEIKTNEIPNLPLKKIPQDDELVVVSEKDDTTKCVMCEFVMTQLEEMLKNNATEEEIKDAVHSVCNYLPKSVAKQCNDFVYEYADLVIQLLVQSLDPKSVCEELSLCQPTAKKTPVTPAKASEVQCKLCLVTVEALDKLLEDGNVEQNIDTLLEKVCSIVPALQKEKCQKLIDEYGPSIALLVAQLADSRDVCAELNLCSSSGASVKMYGSRKCTWGPSYWCKSEFHAMACKATRHCQQKVWKSEKPKKTA